MSVARPVTAASETRNPVVLEVDKLRFVYPPPRPVVALDDVSVSIAAGEYVALIGENGSGKTTLCRCISTYLRPQSGSVRILDKNPFRLSIHERSRHVGYVFQNPDHQLFKDTVWSDVAFSLESIGSSKNVSEDAIETMLEELGLEHKAEVHPFVLSKGERQRLAIAVVAIMRPAILIIDEPTTGLDTVRSHEVMNLLRKLRDQWKMTVIVVTHNMELVAEYCDRAIVMSQGRILLDGPPGSVFARDDVLTKTKLEAPAITNLCARLGLSPAPLRVDDAADRLLARLSG